MSSEALGCKRRARTADVLNAPDPRSEDTSAVKCEKTRRNIVGLKR
jgi:hypothetical protein